MAGRVVWQAMLLAQCLVRGKPSYILVVAKMSFLTVNWESSSCSSVPFSCPAELVSFPQNSAFSKFFSIYYRKWEEYYKYGLIYRRDRDISISGGLSFTCICKRGGAWDCTNNSRHSSHLSNPLTWVTADHQQNWL